MNKELIESITKLSKYIFGFERNTFDWYSSDRECDGCEISIKHGKLEISTWLESHHNGSSYGYHSITIDSEEEQDKLLLELKITLVNKAMNKMASEIAEEEKRNRKEKIKTECQDRLKRIGILD